MNSPPLVLPPPQTHLVQSDLLEYQRHYLHRHLGAVFLDENVPRADIIFVPGVVVLGSEREQGLWVLRAYWQKPPEGLPVTRPAWVQRQIEKVLENLP